MRSFLTNLWECFLDTSHSLPERKYKIFTLLKDHGIRLLSCGNASGGTYQGAYRSFLVKYREKTFFMNLSFFNYGTSTILTVSVDQDNHRPHNAYNTLLTKTLFGLEKHIIFTIMAELLLEKLKVASLLN